jgi:lycopene cyclase domain-containing protein
MSLYLAVELSALAIPLAFSFDRKVAYYRLWPFILPAIILNAILFVGIDIYFTSSGTWGFNPAYHSDIIIAGLPLEEILFFFIIPYCSLFIHYVFVAYLPDSAIRKDISIYITTLLVLILCASAIIFLNRSYTFFYSILTVVVILAAWLTNNDLLSRYYITFLIIMIPFLIVNGILTGTFIEGSVFWYSSNDISGLKLFTIPVEDALFGFSLILLNLLTAEYLRKKLKR